MKPEDKKRFGAVMNGLGATYGKELTTPLVDLYWRAMEEMTIEQVEAAAAKMLTDQDQKFWPRPADFLKHSGTPSREELALDAWGSLLDAIREHGAYTSVKFDDPALGATVRVLGGWVRLCDTPAEQMHAFTRSAFLKAYEVHAVRDRDGEGYHPGLFELEERGIPVRMCIAAPYLATARPAVPQLESRA